MTWGESIEEGKKQFYKNPLSYSLWYPDGSIKSSYFVHMFSVIFFHYLPAYLIDFLLIILRKKPLYEWSYLWRCLIELHVYFNCFPAWFEHKRKCPWAQRFCNITPRNGGSSRIIIPEHCLPGWRPRTRRHSSLIAAKLIGHCTFKVTFLVCVNIFSKSRSPVYQRPGRTYKGRTIYLNYKYNYLISLPSGSTSSTVRWCSPSTGSFCGSCGATLVFSWMASSSFLRSPEKYYRARPQLHIRRPIWCQNQEQSVFTVPTITIL